MHPYIASAIADDRIHDMRATASRSRLVRIARCCKPSTIRTAARALQTRLALPVARQGAPTAACC